MKSKLVFAVVMLSLWTLSACNDEDAAPSPGPNTPPVPVSDDWKTSAPFTGGSRLYATGFSIGEKGYVGTGQKGTTFYNDLWEYDPKSNVWTQKQDFPGGSRTDALAFGIGTKGYVGTGSKLGTFQKDFWEFDPIGNAWKPMDDFAGGGRDHVVGFQANGKGYAGLGTLLSDGVYTFPKDFWEFNPAAAAGQQWKKKQDIGNDFYQQLPSGAGKGFGFSVKGKGYLGIDMTNSSYDFWEFDAVENKWTSKATLKDQITQNSIVSFTLKDNGYVQSGIKVLRYEPGANRWVAKKDLPVESLRYSTGFVVGDNAYVGLGSTLTSSPQEFYRYTPN